MAAFARSALTNFQRKRYPGTRLWVWVLGVVCVAILSPGNFSGRVALAPTIALLPKSGDASPGHPTLSADGVYLPATLNATQPVGVLLALHGFASSGPAIAQRLRGCADQYGWLIVAPTMAYRDYFDTEQLRSDASQNLPAVYDLIEQVRGAASGLELQSKLLVYGFSRGAQMAHRFSIVYPGEVAAVATLSAGSYTLPEGEDITHTPLRFPFGIADLSVLVNRAFDLQAFKQIPFWVGVGADDNNPADTSRAWDAYEGQTRVARAEAFAGDLHRQGNLVDLHVFGQAGHQETGSMRLSACAFLAAHASLQGGSR